MAIDFNEEKIGLEWNYIRYPVAENYSLGQRKGFLRLKGSEVKIGERNSPTFTGRRIQDMFFSATTSVEFNPKSLNEEAGLILLNNGSHFDLLIKRSGSKRVLITRLQFGSVTHEFEEVVLKPGPVQLRITGARSTFSFSYSQDNKNFKEIARADSKFLSSETVGGFTGVYAGLYATGNGKISASVADFDWFEYKKEQSTNTNPGFQGF